MPIEPWKILATKDVFSHRWYHLRQDTVELPDGSVVDDYFVSVRPDIVVVFALTPVREVVLVRQYRHGSGEIALELPAGFFTEGESALDAARRELAEETGYTCSTWTQIATIYTDASRHTNRVYAFLATGAECTGPQVLDPTEQAAGVEVLTMPLEQVLEQVRSGRITSMSTVTTVYRAIDALQAAGQGG